MTSVIVKIDLTAEGLDLNELLRRVNKDAIIQALFITNGDKAKAARLLNLGRTTLTARMRKLKISSEVQVNVWES